MRVRTGWKNRDRQRSPREIASALAAVVWKGAGQLVLNLENEGFQTESNPQRLDVFAEVGAFAVQAIDRLVYERFGQAQRSEFVTALAQSLAQLMQENRSLLQGPGDYRRPFIELINRRGEEYAGNRWDAQEGPSFVMRRNFGNYVSEVMGPKDRRWITDYVMDVETPKLLDALRRAVPGLLG